MCYTLANAEVIGSEEYFDYIIELGVKFAWFFTYMPLGKGTVTELMASAEQREMMYHRIREYRSSKKREYGTTACGGILPHQH